MSSESRTDLDLRTRALLSSTPMESALPTDTDSVSAEHVVETGRSGLNRSPKRFTSTTPLRYVETLICVFFE